MKASLVAITSLLALAACGGGPSKPAEDPSTHSEVAVQKPPPGAAAKDDGGADVAEAEAALTAGNAEKAKTAAESAIAKNPKNAKAHYYLGTAADALGDKPLAEKHLREALAIAPGLVDAAVNLSAILLDQNKGADAAKLLKPLLDKSPDDPMLLANYAAALLSANDAGAADAYGKLYAKTKKPEHKLGQTDALVAAGKKEDAAKLLKEAADGAGVSRDFRAAIAKRLAQLAQYDDAIKTIDKAIADKSSADLLTYRALFKRSKKDATGAKADLEAAIKEDPKFAHAYVYLGEIFEELKKPADAKKAYEQAVANGGDGPAAKKAKEKLDKLKK